MTSHKGGDEPALHRRQAEQQRKPLPESPILTPSGAGWNGLCMHHIDAHRLDDGSWIACVDGFVGEKE